MSEIEYAGFWVRFGALIIDVVIAFIVFYVPLSFIYGDTYLQGGQLVYGIWDVLLGWIAPIVATIWFWLKYKATPGKMVSKIEVVDAQTGLRLNFRKAILRYFAYIISTIPFGLGFIWVSMDNKKQGWHDKMAGSVVIHNNRQKKVELHRH